MLLKFLFPYFLSFLNFNHVDVQGKWTVLCSSFAWIIYCNLKNRGVNFSLNDCTYFHLLLVFFLKLIFSWNFDNVDLQGNRSVLRISLTWIICCNLENRGVNFLSNNCTSFSVAAFILAARTAVILLCLKGAKLKTIGRFLFPLIKSLIVIIQGRKRSKIQYIPRVVMLQEFSQISSMHCFWIFASKEDCKSLQGQ